MWWRENNRNVVAVVVVVVVVENNRNVVVEKRKVGVGSVWGPCRVYVGSMYGRCCRGWKLKIKVKSKMENKSIVEE